MNAKRRKAVQLLIADIREHEARHAVLEERLKALAWAEGDTFDNVPTDLRGSRASERIEVSYELLEKAYALMTDIDFSEVVERMEKAVE